MANAPSNDDDPPNPRLPVRRLCADLLLCITASAVANFGVRLTRELLCNSAGISGGARRQPG